ncbi:MAG TPA: protein-L-isoaspartate(D-aspartate) O-methyltransferase [Noviherbaspirillum sp.]|nr:protein-L-isoaspartate(D-aspartate) O-methyltransferase [Noviherbaspirillum sp.]
MSGKDKRFPLSLSSVVDKLPGTAHGGNRSQGKVATPQTATQNAAQNMARIPHAADSQIKSTGGMQPTSSTTPRPASLVSNAVRTAMVARLGKQGVKDGKVLAAMEAIPRHLFVEPGLASQAYIDASLPIGHHQTISQPYIVARMIEILRANANDGALNKVLEIGTGCGYQAAVLSLVAKEVYSIERIKPLHELAKANLRPLRIANIRLQYGDGMLGLPQAAPFDGIILAAAGLEVPQSLLDQMTIGGRLIAPVGGRHQVLQLIERVSKFEWTNTTLEDCHFVPLRPGVM